MLRLDKCNGKDVELAYRGVCKSQFYPLHNYSKNPFKHVSTFDTYMLTQYLNYNATYEKKALFD